MNRTRMIRQSWPCLGVACLQVAFLVQGLAFSAANSQTFDEATHLAAGYSYLATGDFRLNPQHPCLAKELAALPVYLWYRLPFEPPAHAWNHAQEWEISLEFLYHSPVPADDLLRLARVPNLLLGVCLVGLVGWWAYRLWGRGAAVLAAGLAAFDPNLVAHASLVTTDLAPTLFMFLTFYLLWEYTAAPSGPLLVALGVSTGLALASKYSMVVLPGFILVYFGVHALWGRLDALAWTCPRAGDKPAGLGWRLAGAAVAAAVIGLLAVAVTGLCYFEVGLSLWWTGFQDFRQRQEHGHLGYLFGQLSQFGWWYYFPAAMALKTPVGSLLLIALSLALFPAGTPWRRRDTAFLLVPVLLWLGAASQARFNIGLRHVLPVYPFLMVAASRLATVRWRRLPWLAPAALTLTVIGVAASSLRVAPHQLAYFNELAGGPEGGFRYLSDSNLDWGQDLQGLKAYMDREGLPIIYFSYFGSAPPDYYGIRYQFAPGVGRLTKPPKTTLPSDSKREVLAVSVVNLQGVYFLADHTLYHWFLNLRPVEKIGYSIYVYDLTGNVPAHLQLAQIYLKHNLSAAAERELQRVLSREPSNAEAKALLGRLAGGPEGKTRASVPKQPFQARGPR